MIVRCLWWGIFYIFYIFSGLLLKFIFLMKNDEKVKETDIEKNADSWIFLAEQICAIQLTVKLCKTSYQRRHSASILLKYAWSAMLYMLVHALKREKEFLYKFQCYHSLSLSHSHTDIHIFLLLLFIFLNRMFSIYSTIYAYIRNLNHRNLLYVWIKWSYWKINFIMKKRMTAFGLARLFFCLPVKTQPSQPLDDEKSFHMMRCV